MDIKNPEVTEDTDQNNKSVQEGEITTDAIEKAIKKFKKWEIC